MRKECGIFAALGIQSATPIPNHIINQGMQHIQHCGQDSYGLITLSDTGRGEYKT